MEQAYWLAWAKIKDVGPVLIKRLYEHFGALSLAWQAAPAELLAVDGIGLVTADQIRASRSHINPEHLLDQHTAQFPNFWTPADPNYPKLLWEIPDPPPILYHRGPFRPNQSTAITVGIVGTRRPSPYGRRWTQRLSRRLSQKQITVVSGMAIGIDTYAHQSCLESDGQTIAVLGTGVDVVYPRSNEHLYKRILETGLILSEYPDGVPPDRAHFPRRNRIIAGLSHATLVTEAPERSGALITAYLANDYGRHVYALPDGLDNPTARGCLVLVNTGATIVMGEDQLVQELLNIGVAHQFTNNKAEEPANYDEGISSEKQQEPPEKETLEAMSELVSEVELDQALQPIFQVIPDCPISLDNLVKTTQLDTSVLLSGLLQLELAGVIVQLPGGQYRRT
ncbi:DNA-processing protein DprA [Leptothoe spongobia]|uniref:DNA-protecting protein DprA n=1 Tax=Leptothoe spongobia TAU-MAC 1115 TaxID=1967444 RepID=A0A947DGI8_9CYAN|nr:DNA-processing protein DprA [Leptothoe spongobia]MBT9315516.1 DNA-protecting protein DprA [Leptothoe spongobia TAU-MAC 1115]